MSSPPGYEALLAGPAFVRRADRAVLRVTGADRVSWLQGLVTNDIAAIRPGNRIYSAYLTPQGRMITDVWVVAMADALLLDVPAPVAASLAARLDGLIFTENVQIADASAELTAYQFFGTMPGDGLAVAFVGDTTYGIASNVGYIAAANAAAVPVSVRPPAQEVGLDVLEVVRVEAGVPRFLVDMTEDTIPLEAGIEDRAISFTKGCYVGQEVIIRVLHRGHGRVARKLVALRIDGDVPERGAKLFSADREAGAVTSAARSPRLGSIALAYVHRDFVAPGTHLEVETPAGRAPAAVSERPMPSADR